MKKRKAAKVRKVKKRVRHTPSYALGGSKKKIWGVDHDFILIVGGGFVLVMLGLMLFNP